jgi:beta-1,4-mannosyltransferase
VHNLEAHDPALQREQGWFFERFVRHVDAFVCMSEAARSAAIETFPDIASKPSTVIPHGDFRSSYRRGTESQADARRRLGLDVDARVMLCFGYMRANKRLVEFATAFSKTDDDSLSLAMVGRPQHQETVQSLQAIAAGDSRLVVRPEAVEDDETYLWFRAADVVVLPYDVLNSGAAMLALSFDRPVAMPKAATSDELAASVGEQWVIGADDVLEAAIKVAYSPQSGEPDLSRHSWTIVGEKVFALYQGVLG